MKEKQLLKKMVFAAMIAAIYATVTVVLAPISYGNIQIRIAEALVLLPLLFDPALWGITLGCFIANLIGAMMGTNPLGYLDCIIGTFATFTAAVCTMKLKHIQIHNIPWLSILMPVLFNGIIIGLELAFAFTPETLLSGFMIFGFEVALGELIAVVVFGIPLISALKKAKIQERFEL